MLITCIKQDKTSQITMHPENTKGTCSQLGGYEQLAGADLHTRQLSTPYGDVHIPVTI
jgi:hypothetical protein